MDRSCRYVDSLLDSAGEFTFAALSVEMTDAAELVDSAGVAVTTVSVRTLLAVDPVLKVAVAVDLASDAEAVSAPVLAAPVALYDDPGVDAACEASLVKLEVALAMIERFDELDESSSVLAAVVTDDDATDVYDTATIDDDDEDSGADDAAAITDALVDFKVLLLPLLDSEALLSDTLFW